MSKKRTPIRGFSQAVLYSPIAFAKLSPGGDQLFSYVLMAQLPPEVIDWLRNPLQPSALQVRFALTPRGLVCAALVIQAGTLQVRFIVPLMKSEAQDWLTEATERRQEFVCAFNRPGTKQMEVARFEFAVNEAFEKTMASIRLALPRQPQVEPEVQREELHEAVAAFAESGRSLLAEAPELTDTWYLVVTDIALATE